MAAPRVHTTTKHLPGPRICLPERAVGRARNRVDIVTHKNRQLAICGASLIAHARVEMACQDSPLLTDPAIVSEDATRYPQAGVPAYGVVVRVFSEPHRVPGYDFPPIVGPLVRSTDNMMELIAVKPVQPSEQLMRQQQWFWPAFGSQATPLPAYSAYPIQLDAGAGTTLRVADQVPRRVLRSSVRAALSGQGFQTSGAVSACSSGKA